MLTLDHIAVAAARLDDGVAYVEAALGVSMQPGGEHPSMGTHNKLLGLAEGLYLEVIAINPEAPPPQHPRWFDLDNFSGGPRITNWIARTDDLAAVLERVPNGAGKPVSLSRGDLRWQMAVPTDGKLPFDGAFPALIEWEGDAHPAQRLQPVGCALRHLTIAHPGAAALKKQLDPLLQDARVSIVDGAFGFEAVFNTPHGPRTLR